MILSFAQYEREITAERSYVGRILRLTLLAPDIVDAIAHGREPSGPVFNAAIAR